MESLTLTLHLLTWRVHTRHSLNTYDFPLQWRLFKTDLNSRRFYFTVVGKKWSVEVKTIRCLYFQSQSLISRLSSYPSINAAHFNILTFRIVASSVGLFSARPRPITTSPIDPISDISVELKHICLFLKPYPFSRCGYLQLYLVNRAHSTCLWFGPLFDFHDLGPKVAHGLIQNFK